MLDGPARPMTGIQGAGYPGTAQVLIYTVQYVQFTVYSVQCMYKVNCICILYSALYTVHFTVHSFSAVQGLTNLTTTLNALLSDHCSFTQYICTIYTR